MKDVEGWEVSWRGAWRAASAWHRVGSARALELGCFSCALELAVSVLSMGILRPVNEPGGNYSLEC